MFILLSILGVALVALITTGSTIRRIAGLLIAACIVASPFLLTCHSVFERLVVTTCAIVASLKGIELAAEREPWPTGRRLLHTFVMFDTRLARHTASHFQARRFGEAVLWGIVCILAMRSALSATHSVTGWFFLIVGLGAAFETLARVISVVWALAGFSIPLVHNAPHRSLSVREFWSLRWNRVMGRWLREYCYAPLARRGSRELGFIATFFVSAIVHWYIVTVLIGWYWALMAMAFFLVQIPIIFIEDMIRIRRWSPFAAHAWTTVVLLATSPLIAEPMLRLLAALP